MTFAAIAAAALTAPGPAGPLAPPDAGRQLVCWGYEDSGNITEDQPMWPCHLVNFFVTGKNPHSSIHTLQEHVDWVKQPGHSYVNDGTGGLCVWAHPGPDDAEAMVALDGLTGMELSHGGDSTSREHLWDHVLTLCHDRGRPYLWGFAADDTHSRTRIGLSFLATRLPEFSERALKNALRTGAFYTSSGPLIADIRVTGGTATVTLPAPAEVRWLKSGQFGVGPPNISPKAGENHCLKRDVAVTTSAYTLNDEHGTTDAKTARFIRAIVIDAEGRIAHTMPFRIEGAKALHSPCPAEGTWYRGMTHNHCDATGSKRTPVVDYHAAYRARGHHWTFATDYGYWLTPFQRYPEDPVPVVQGVTPDRGPADVTAKIIVYGERLGQGDILVGGRPAADVTWLYENRIEATMPKALPPGPHDVTFVGRNGFRHTLPDAYTAQEAGAGNDGWTTWTTLNSALPGDRTFCVACAEKDIWVGTQYGAARFDGRRWEAVTRKNNDSIGDAILSIAADGKGNVWLGSFRGLTQRTPGGEWRLYRTEAGLPSREVNRCFVDSKDNLWIIYNGRSNQASRFDGKTWTHVTPPNAEGQRMCVAIGEDALGRILISPRRSGVGVFDGNEWAVWNARDTGLGDDFVRQIRRGRSGALYFATTALGEKPAGGLSILRDGKWTTYGQSRNGLASYHVWDVCEDRRGNVWCATSRGVSRMAPDGTWRTFTTANSGLAFDFVLGVTEAPDGAMWFATARGISRFQPPR